MTHQTDVKPGDNRSPAHAALGVNRRSVMSALSSVALLPAAILSPSIAQGSPVPLGTDSEIVRIATHILNNLLPKYREATEAADAACKEEMKRTPDYPDVLIWRVTDPVGRMDNEGIKRAGKRYLICDLSEIERRKNKPPMMRWTFVGTDEQAIGVRSEDHFDGDKYCHPKREFAHLWQGTVDTRRAERMRELIEAADRRKQEIEAIRNELGIAELCDRQEELADEIYTEVEQLTCMRAHSVGALRAKAAVFAQHLFQHDDTLIDGHQGFDLVRSLIDDLEGSIAS